MLVLLEGLSEGGKGDVILFSYCVLAGEGDLLFDVK